MIEGKTCRPPQKWDSYAYFFVALKGIILSLIKSEDHYYKN